MSDELTPLELAAIREWLQAARADLDGVDGREVAKDRYTLAYLIDRVNQVSAGDASTGDGPEVLPSPVTDEEIAALPVLDLNAFEAATKCGPYGAGSRLGFVEAGEPEATAGFEHNGTTVPAGQKVVDLMQKLQESIDAAKEARRRGGAS